MKRFHFRYYFGGIALILLVLQLITGIFLTMYYEPNLREAYASVQALYQDSFLHSWMRDSHRWLAFFIVTSVVVHFFRSLLRKDYLRPRKRVSWLTGMLLILVILFISVTGFILPWEWKGYWFMEMVPNLAGELPFIGEPLKNGLISFFTLNRVFVAHILLLPLVSIILIDIHVFGHLRNRKGGIPRYLMMHGLITLPVIVVVAVLAATVQMPTSDPDIIPLPLEGRFVPTIEWYVLIFYVPFMYFENWIGPTLGLYLPGVLFLLLAAAPFFLRRKPLEERKKSKLSPTMKKVAAFVVVTSICSVFFGSVYTAGYRSPTMGCNSCHNIYMGRRMGVPPDDFRDREKLPLLDDNQWMVEHWFAPQQTW